MQQADLPANPPSPISSHPKTRWLTIFQFVLSLLGVLVLWGVALMTTLVGLLGGIQTSAGTSASTPLFITAASAAAGGLLLLPSVVLSLRRIISQTTTAPARFSKAGWPSFIIIALPFILILGNYAATKSGSAWVLLPPLHVLAVLVPIVWLVYLAVRGLPIGSRQRSWGVFDSGLMLGPIIIITLELVSLAILIALSLIYISGSPELSSGIALLAEELSSSTPSSDTIIQLIAPYLTSPALITAAIAFIALLVPLVEEAVKPIGVWLLLRRSLSPAEGFAAGALSGAGFAIFESLAASSTGEGWLILVAGRIGTAAVHILTTALMGWALVLARSQKRYLRLVGTYLGVVLIHGAWNALTMFAAINGIRNDMDLGVSEILPQISPFTPYILAVMALLIFAALLWVNRHLRHSQDVAEGNPPQDEQNSIVEQSRGVL